LLQHPALHSFPTRRSSDLAIEQPVGANDFEGLRRIRNETGIPVMADESLVTIEQARRLIELRACDFFNIRISKCGGVTGSLAMRSEEHTSELQSRSDLVCR